MNSGDSLAQLRDIHLPAPVSWWPLAPGWWIVGAVLLIALLAGVVIVWSRYRQRRYRRAALQQLQALYAQWQQQGDAAQYLQNTNRLLKQTALAAYPRRDIAALNGAAWLQFLDACLRKPHFGNTELRALASVYEPQPAAIEPAALQHAAAHWIRRHRC